MTRQTMIFDHETPSAPTLTGGMLLDTAGVKMRALQALGSLVAASSADGSFSDTNGYGQFDYCSDGFLYVADTANNRVQKFEKNAAGQWVFHSKLASPLGGGSNLSLLAIDRSVSPNQIHLAAWDQTVTNGTWIGVWSLSGGLAGINSGNRLRSYGSNSAASDASGRAFVGLGLTIDSTVAVVTSFFTPFRLLRWNHLTGALLNEETQANNYARFATDYNGNWWGGGTTGAAEAGLWKIDITSFTGLSRLDTSISMQVTRRKRISATSHVGPAYYDGRVYIRPSVDQVQAWNASDNSYVDEFLWPGGMGTSSPHFGHAPGIMNGLGGRVLGKHRFVVSGGVAEYIMWATNADGDNTQCFLLCWQVTPAVATWVKSDWSAGTNTLLSLLVNGTNVSGEKYKVRLRKNGGAWVTITANQLTDAAALASVGTFTEGDELEVELTLSTWDRMDGHATLVSTRDKLPPTNVFLAMDYEDTAIDVFVPVPVGGLSVGLGGGGLSVELG